MSFEAKHLLLSGIEDRLKALLPATTTNDVMRQISEDLSQYDIEAAADYKPNYDMVEAFISAKDVEGRSKKTLQRYRYIIGKLLKSTKVPVEKISVYHIRAYLANERNKGIKERTLEGERSVFCSFFNWLQKEHLIDRNPCDNLGAIRYQKTVRKPFSTVDIEKLKEQCTRDRDKALISFLLTTGCRVSEVCGINRQDVNLEKRECIVSGKGNKQRKVYFDDVTAMLIKRYLDGRKDDSEPLFVGQRGERFLPGGVRYILKTISEKAHVGKCHPHRFRRTMATNLINHGMGIQEVAFLLGHEKIDTTMQYVYIEESNVKNSYQRYT